MSHIQQNPPSGDRPNKIPLKERTVPLTPDQIEALLEALGDGWRVAYGHHLSKIYTFSDFEETLQFTGRVGALAESVDGCPSITLTRCQAEVSLWTLAVDGLTQNDFSLASKISQLIRA